MKAIVARLDDICDIERIVGRIAVNRAGPRDLAALAKCLASLPSLLDQLAALPMNRWLTRAYAKTLLRFTPKPDLAYVLDADPKEACARKPEYPLEFMREYRKSYLALSRMAGLHLVHDGTPEEVHLAILRRFTKVVPSLQPQPQVDSEVLA